MSPTPSSPTTRAIRAIRLVPFWKPITPRGYIGWGKSTQLGYGLGLALGAKLAAPEKQVINVMGDAAFGMSGLDLETAVRAQIPILTVVLNNGVMTNYDSHMPYASDRFAQQRAGRQLRCGGRRARRPCRNASKRRTDLLRPSDRRWQPTKRVSPRSSRF